MITTIMMIFNVMITIIMMTFNVMITIIMVTINVMITTNMTILNIISARTCQRNIPAPQASKKCKAVGDLGEWHSAWDAIVILLFFFLFGSTCSVHHRQYFMFLSFWVTSVFEGMEKYLRNTRNAIYINEVFQKHQKITFDVNEIFQKYQKNTFDVKKDLRRPRREVGYLSSVFHRTCTELL